MPPSGHVIAVQAGPILAPTVPQPILAPPANVPNPGMSGGIPAELDCPMRKLAYRFAQKLQARAHPAKKATRTQVGG